MVESARLLEELAVFSDLGVDPPSLFESGADYLVRMIRLGKTTTLRFEAGGAGPVTETVDDATVNHASYRALLASERFGQLRQWADVQAAVLERAGQDRQLIHLQGYLASMGSVTGADALDDLLVTAAGPASHLVDVMLIDGPAGIGKTFLIEALAYRRARSFVQRQRPLLLHVQSRGRILTFLQDLIAFSLQRLRLSVTFDQLPILVRHGLVSLAIDGFDELGDPNGYENAWAQVDDLLQQVRGGTMILAGRESFIGRDRLYAKLNSLDPAREAVDSLTLRLPDVGSAKDWLRRQGWGDDLFELLSDFFVEGSYALRPFFLSKIADTDLAGAVANDEFGPTLSFLVNVMVERETGKFHAQVEAAMEVDARDAFIRRFLSEVAREMAENQTEALDETTIRWLAESTVDEDLPEEVSRLLQNRALAMVFLTADERRGYLRFAHGQFQNYFLAHATIDAIADGELPKFVRRNILGSDFLAAFSDATLDVFDREPDKLPAFVSRATEHLLRYPHVDRGPRNLAGLLIACLPLADQLPDLSLTGRDVDEAVVRGWAAPAVIRNTDINQLDVRGASVDAVVFEGGSVGGLLMDFLSRVSPSLKPAYVQVETPSGKVELFTGEQRDIWLSLHGGERMLAEHEGQDAVDHDHELVRLLDKVLRYRGYWLRENSDVLSERLTGHQLWPELLDILRRHDLVREEMRPSSGQAAKFVHVKRAPEILARADDQSVSAFWEEIKARTLQP